MIVDKNNFGFEVEIDIALLLHYAMQMKVKCFMTKEFEMQQIFISCRKSKSY